MIDSTTTTARLVNTKRKILLPMSSLSWTPPDPPLRGKRPRPCQLIRSILPWRPGPDQHGLLVLEALRDLEVGRFGLRRLAIREDHREPARPRQGLLGLRGNGHVLLDGESRQLREGLGQPAVDLREAGPNLGPERRGEGHRLVPHHPDDRLDLYLPLDGLPGKLDLHVVRELDLMALRRTPRHLVGLLENLKLDVLYGALFLPGRQESQQGRRRFLRIG